MRDFFIRSMEQIINALVVLGAIAVVMTAIMVMGSPQGGLVRGIAVLIFGAIYLVLMAGMVYLGLGIYNNTRRTAEATEEIARR
ncbi:hypothetical protein [Paracoccus aminophilus]|uniref:Uncharacterized protein n=1 Tax=Paracoccus aminophilus JCM 7686 TaxID=1367847 RepID=S5XQN4_PARAH|nr:hypothetical protein [Paracoccus aminophilus]AGT07377.1 hypothetical protein JCM7686_0266 [Paracoccus aminophilus JCM 7686]